MKKFLFIVCALMAAVTLFAQDIIVTKEAQKIDAKILEVSTSEIRYKELDNLDGPVFMLRTDEINSIIYANGKVVLYNQPKSEKKILKEQHIDERTIEVLMLSGEKIIAQVDDLKSDVIYCTINGEHQTIASSLVEKVTFLQNGQVKQYNMNTTSAKNIMVSKNKESNLARVSNFSGVCVFTDCIPVAEYEILGETYFDKEWKQHGTTYTYYNPQSKSVNTAGYTYNETPQYTDIRDALIAQAIMANRLVEGVLIEITKEGEGRATLIKFKEGATNKDMAKVNTHLGVLVFTDCVPVNTYTFVGKIPKAGVVSSAYFSIRDKLINKVQKKFPEAEGVIIHLVSGGNDTAEAIKF